MPRGDGTGPRGTGSIGRGRGSCQGMGLDFGGAFGRGRRGMRTRFGSAGNTETASATLEEQAASLEKQAAKLRELARISKTE